VIYEVLFTQNRGNEFVFCHKFKIRNDNDKEVCNDVWVVTFEVSFMCYHNNIDIGSQFKKLLVFRGAEKIIYVTLLCETGKMPRM